MIIVIDFSEYLFLDKYFVWDGSTTSTCYASTLPDRSTSRRNRTTTKNHACWTDTLQRINS
jgi:hypothetical protein